MEFSTDHQITGSILEDQQVKQIAENRQLIADLLAKPIFLNKVKKIFVCTPCQDHGCENSVNFILEFENDVEEQFNIECNLMDEIQKILTKSDINLYSRGSKIEALTGVYTGEKEKQNIRAILHAGIPIIEFDCQTNDASNEEFNQRFIKWQQSQDKVMKQEKDSHSLEQQDKEEKAENPGQSPLSPQALQGKQKNL